MKTTPRLVAWAPAEDKFRALMGLPPHALQPQPVACLYGNFKLEGMSDMTMTMTMTMTMMMMMTMTFVRPRDVS